MTVDPIADAMARARAADLPPPDFDAVLGYRRPQRRTRRSVYAVVAGFVACGAMATTLLHRAPSPAPSYAVTLPDFTASLTQAAEPARLPRLDSLNPRGVSDAAL